MPSFILPTMLLICSLVIFCLAFYVHHMETKIKILRTVRNLESTLPVGTKCYYDGWTGRECLRCHTGKIATRERFQTFCDENGKLVLNALPRVHWCDTCKYRNTSLELEETTNLK